MNDEQSNEYSILSQQVNNLCKKITDSIGSPMSLEEASDLVLPWFRQMYDLYYSSTKYKTMIFLRMQEIVTYHGSQLKRVFTSTNPAVTEQDKKKILDFKEITKNEVTFISNANSALRSLSLT